MTNTKPVEMKLYPVHSVQRAISMPCPECNKLAHVSEMPCDWLYVYHCDSCKYDYVGVIRESN